MMCNLRSPCLSLEEAFLMLFSMASNKEGWVAEALEQAGKAFRMEPLLFRTVCNSSVRSLYASLTRGGRERFLTSIVWSTWVPMKGGFFAWEVTLGRILMVGQLKRTGMDFTE
ncbi:hypothetical protein CK203_081004 [Vitis vinifera]|uniref:Reverse transcriptase zinc-binding domain-containing protein n=1 Tax=Vitis vinifera TaxID=29760 RepID=A0A438EMQ8_VITVI|nr:hypothetical protein CK203_081004 [Vitis vinifera]